MNEKYSINKDLKIITIFLLSLCLLNYLFFFLSDNYRNALGTIKEGDAISIFIFLFSKGPIVLIYVHLLYSLKTNSNKKTILIIELLMLTIWGALCAVPFIGIFFLSATPFFIFFMTLVYYHSGLMSELKTLFYYFIPVSYTILHLYIIFRLIKTKK